MTRTVENASNVVSRDLAKARLPRDTVRPGPVPRLVLTPLASAVTLALLSFSGGITVPE